MQTGLVHGGGPGGSRRRKAAMVVQLALAGGRPLPLDRLPESVQIALARELATLNLVDQATLDRVAAEFAAELAGVALSAPSSLDAALKLLEGHISPAAATALRDEHDRATGADPWPRVLALEAEDLRPIMDSESVEVCAVVLSKLPVAKAAALLGLLPGEHARRITYAVSRTQGVSPAAVHRIGEALAETYGRAPAPAFADKAGRRLGAILNSSTAAAREDLLASLHDEDPDFAEEVRRAIFTFPDLPERVSLPDIAKVIRLMDTADLVKALAAASAAGGPAEAAARFLLSGISKRMADSLREEMEELGAVSEDAADEAQGRVIAAIRAAADAGEIVLRTAPDPKP
jgi:flagellar motor switch protein FliG